MEKVRHERDQIELAKEMDEAEELELVQEEGEEDLDPQERMGIAISRMSVYHPDYYRLPEDAMEVQQSRQQVPIPVE